MGYALRKDGRGFRRVDSPADILSDETYQESQPVIEQDTRQAAILRRIAEIDLLTVRPLRAICAGTSTDEDHSKIESLEQEVASLRVELATL